MAIVDFVEIFDVWWVLWSVPAAIAIGWAAIHVYCFDAPRGAAAWEVAGIFVDVSAVIVNLNPDTHDKVPNRIYAVGSLLHALFMPSTGASKGLMVVGFWALVGEMLEQCAVLMTLEYLQFLIVVPICTVVWIATFFWAFYHTGDNETPAKKGFLATEVTMAVLSVAAATQDIRNILLILPEIPLGLITTLRMDSFTADGGPSCEDGVEEP